MKRAVKAAAYLILTALLCILLQDFHGLYLSQKTLFSAHARGLHYGPSEEILVMESNPDGYGIVVGRLEDGGYSILPMKQKLGVFWGLAGGGISPEVHPDEEVEFNFYYGVKSFVIMVQNPEIKEVYFCVKLEDRNGELYEEEHTASVDESGLVFLNRYEDLKGIEIVDTSYYDDFRMEGRDAAGNVIWELQQNL